MIKKADSCPICGSSGNVVKNGWLKGKQRYLCRKCKYSFRNDKPYRISKSIKINAINLRIKGLSYGNIGKKLGRSSGSVYNWVKKNEEQNKLNVDNILLSIESTISQLNPTEQNKVDKYINKNKSNFEELEKIRNVLLYKKNKDNKPRVLF